MYQLNGSGAGGHLVHSVVLIRLYSDLVWQVIKLRGSKAKHYYNC